MRSNLINMFIQIKYKFKTLNIYYYRYIDKFNEK